MRSHREVSHYTMALVAAARRCRCSDEAPRAGVSAGGRLIRHLLRVPRATYGGVLMVALAVVSGGCAFHFLPPPPPRSSPAPPPTGARASVDRRGPTSNHDDALGRLLDAPWNARSDRRRTVTLPLPDGEAWTHVRFWGVTTLAGWRYGDDHHAVAAVFTFPAGGKRGPATLDRCAQRFESWGRARAKAFDVLIGDQRVDVVQWSQGAETRTARVLVFDAERRALFSTKVYAAAYGIYPAWSDACLVVGFAAAQGGDSQRAYQLRDRVVREALPSVVARAGAGALALEAQIDVD